MDEFVVISKGAVVPGKPWAVEHTPPAESHLPTPLVRGRPGRTAKRRSPTSAPVPTAQTWISGLSSGMAPSPVQELSEAAKLMRERAAGVPRDWCLIGSQIVAVGTEALPGTDVIGTCMVPQRAAYVAGMPPPVALAVADLLDSVAARWLGVPAGPAEPEAEDIEAALAVARAVPGRTT